MHPSKPKRKRGIFLTPTGLVKFQQAKRASELQHNGGDRYTLEDLSDLTGLAPSTVMKVLGCEVAVDKQTLLCLFGAFKLEVSQGDFGRLSADIRLNATETAVVRQDWGEAVDVSVFYGRIQELMQLERWIVIERCRLVALLGMGGIGKTTLAVRLAQQLQHQFEFIVWRTLRDAPPVGEVLAEMIQFLSGQQETNLPSNTSSRISRFLKYLRSSRCLVVLDNVETILGGKEVAGSYRTDYEGYGELFKCAGEVAHQSCLLLTSREIPKEVALLSSAASPVRTLQLPGLSAIEGQSILQEKGLTTIPPETQWTELVNYYAGNPLALKIAATHIKYVFDGNVSEFFHQGAIVFGDLKELLAQQFERLPELEQEIMYWLATRREPVTLAELCADMVIPSPKMKLATALESLGRRSLLEKIQASFTLQPVVMEYVTSRFIEQVCREIALGQMKLLGSHALMQVTVKDYVRDTQVRLILQPTINELLAVLKSRSNIEFQLRQTLEILKEQAPQQPSYAGGNILNLLCQMQVELSGYDFSHLFVWQADLRQVNLHKVNFAQANLAKSVFADTLGPIFTVAFSPNGKFLVMGGPHSKVRVYQVADGLQLLACQGHTGWVWSVTFNPQGTMIASGSEDKTVKLWDVSTGECVKTLSGHSGTIRSVAFSIDGQTIASGSEDSTIRLWDVSTGHCLKALQSDSDKVTSVAFSPQGTVLASGHNDSAVRLWNISSGQYLKTLPGHTQGVNSVAFSADGEMLASGSFDSDVRLWNVVTGHCLRILPGRGEEVRSVAFSEDKKTLASGSFDSARLWNVATGRCVKILQGHSGRVWSVAFSEDKKTLASGSENFEVRLWDVGTGHCLRTWQGYSNRVLSVAFSPTGDILASSSEDRTAKLWDTSTGLCLKTLRGHSHRVMSVTFSPRGTVVASGSEDQTVKLWDVNTSLCLKTLRGHSHCVTSVTFSLDGQILASGSEDSTVKLWDIITGRCIQTLQEPTSSPIWSVAFNPNGQTLASGSPDNAVRLWDVSTGQCQETLWGHTSWVRSVAFSRDGRLLASGSHDKTVKLWDVSTGQCVDTLHGHSSFVCSVTFLDNRTLASGSGDKTVKLWDVSSGREIRTLSSLGALVWSIAFSSQGRKLVSASENGIIEQWDISTGECLKTLRNPRPYEGMNITGVIGLTEEQRLTLIALGAIEGGSVAN
ncbi:NB-ARC domain-containing protein [Nostoc sp.]|uniref:WD40 domain-containing protein n=1 Tax=Nostoc sp. TaxID=1180 RepID=UPI002FF50F48